MNNITIEVWDATGNKKQAVELPVDASVNRLIAVLVERMNLPRHSPDGQLMSYKFQHKGSGRQLLDEETNRKLLPGDAGAGGDSFARPTSSLSCNASVECLVGPRRDPPETNSEPSSLGGGGDSSQPSSRRRKPKPGVLSRAQRCFPAVENRGRESSAKDTPAPIETRTDTWYNFGRPGSGNRGLSIATASIFPVGVCYPPCLFTPRTARGGGCESRCHARLDRARCGGPTTLAAEPA